MNYFGKFFFYVVSEKQVYKFLRGAMKQIKKDRLFRGPHNFKNRYFEYFDESIGDINNFAGIERILFKGQEIYKLNYHDGLM